MIKLIGKKMGMSHLYNINGDFIPVSIIYIPKQYIVDINKNEEFLKIKLCAFEKKKTTLPLCKFFENKNIPICNKMWEFKYFGNDKLFINKSLDINIMKDVLKVNITGISKGKGFSGVVKRWGFSMQDATHGNSLSHRAPGSIGQNQSPGRVIKGKKMPGHLGNKQITKKNLSVSNINIKDNIIYIKGSIPGYTNSNVFISFNLS